MKIEVRRDAQNTWLALSGNCHYQPDYQVEMIRQTSPKGILPLRLTETSEETAFLYKISDMVSLQKHYRRNKLDDKEMVWITEEIIGTVEHMKRYLLDPDHLILNPSCIFKDEQNLSFCYLPIYKKAFRDSFHVLTEYFVRELDYDNPVAIQTACRLHKYTMEKNYEIDRVIQRVKKEIQEERWFRKAKTENADSQYTDTIERAETHSEAQDMVKPYRESREKKKKMSKWGEWENL